MFDAESDTSDASLDPIAARKARLQVLPESEPDEVQNILALNNCFRSHDPTKLSREDRRVLLSSLLGKPRFVEMHANDLSTNPQCSTLRDWLTASAVTWKRASHLPADRNGRRGPGTWLTCGQVQWPAAGSEVGSWLSFIFPSGPAGIGPELRE